MAKEKVTFHLGHVTRNSVASSGLVRVEDPQLFFGESEGTKKSTSFTRVYVALSGKELKMGVLRPKKNNDLSFNGHCVSLSL